ncbi:TetR/AcrR family transcriptional regulator [Clostridium sp. CX1]|uniref:TetR/AcrR family transcriptional regulator n=1 Tax=Clostridium tanneri TaxID=3037988 RepID=A0ABU4JVD9_9CLOT|nr:MULTISPECIES: TetR/AcrR family transcriptional regulator [unclassified Clostridium]MCT8975243.1 TetR/AcrR family transcriptional regulator [Clostridium sp. CX1]MDW8802119.1 TetR/AcrR family transcriptional regulator [Clostridium sp. A1-XYC3]
MSKSSNDRRTIRTKEMIRKALSELIQEKGFNDISITDLTTRANINRGTFYLHYMDKYDLLEQVENEVMQELYEKIKIIDSTDFMNIDAIREPMPFVIKIFEYFKENSMLMKGILGPKGDSKFQAKIKKFMETTIFEKKLIKTFNPENMLIPKNYFVSYIISAHLGVLQQWLENGMEESPEEMAAILSKMFLLGPLKVVGLNNKIHLSDD